MKPGLHFNLNKGWHPSTGLLRLLVLAVLVSIHASTEVTCTMEDLEVRQEEFAFVNGCQTIRMNTNNVTHKDLSAKMKSVNEYFPHLKTTVATSDPKDKIGTIPGVSVGSSVVCLDLIGLGIWIATVLGKNIKKKNSKIKSSLLFNGCNGLLRMLVLSIMATTVAAHDPTAPVHNDYLRGRLFAILIVALLRLLVRAAAPPLPAPPQPEEEAHEGAFGEEQGWFFVKREEKPRAHKKFNYVHYKVNYDGHHSVMDYWLGMDRKRVWFEGRFVLMKNGQYAWRCAAALAKSNNKKRKCSFTKMSALPVQFEAFNDGPKIPINLARLKITAEEAFDEGKSLVDLLRINHTGSCSIPIQCQNTYDNHPATLTQE